MKNRTLTLMVACLMGMAAYAQWTEPEVPTEASTFTAGHLYRVRNADGKNGYLSGGYAWYGWSTSTILLFDLDVEDPITYSIEMDYDDEGNELGYTFVNSSTSLYTFISNETITDVATGEIDPYTGFGEMHMDGAGTNYSIHYDITLQSGTLYHISVAAADTIYGETKAGTCWGYMPAAEEYIGAVWPFLDPSSSSNACNWEFIDMTMYYARVDLYNALVESQNYADIDQSVVNAASTVYNNASATLEELEAATLDVKTARNYAITKGATSENPVDATMLIENNDFSAGNVSGWYCSFTSGVNAQNIGYQGSYYYNYDYTYVNHEGVDTYPNCDGFIEAWTYTTYSDDAVVGACIGDGELSQTIKEMPKGNWKLSADVIAVQQYETVAEQYGVQLFATSGDYDMSIDISTGNGVPEHIELLFASSGDDLTLGLRTQNTNCNWIAADNFELVCYGDEDSAYKFILQETISQCEADYPDINDVKADNEIKSAYEDALSDARDRLNSGGTDDEYQEASDALSDAAAALKTSVDEYAEVGAYIEYILSVEAMAYENGWDGLVDDLADYREGTLEPGYEDGDLSSETIAEMKDVVSTLISDYISEHCQAGDDVSILITNNDFDTDFSGWDVNVGSVAWGGLAQGENTEGTGAKLADINSGNAEVYWAAFDISQTIKNMPEGLYTLSCQAFERCDAGGGIHAELYAVLPDGSEQSTKIKDLYDEGTEEMLYGDGEWYSDVQVTLNDGTLGWVPNGMSGANVHFYEGHYYNYFNILVTERGDLTIGIRNTNATDWVLFDTFRLVYQGNDAAVYTDYIKELIEEAQALGDAGSLTIEADNMIMAAIELGEDALDSGSGDDCVAAIEALQEAIAFGNETIELTETLQYLLDYTMEVRMLEVVSSDSSLGELVEEVSMALEDGEIENSAKIEEYMLGLKSRYTTYVQCDYLDATEDSPADVTAVILMHECVDNGDEGSTFGWDIFSETTVGLGYGCAEIYNQEIDHGLSQVIYNLAAGYYRLGVQAFYRPGNSFSTNILIPTEEIEEADTIHYADLFAGDKATRVLSIYADAEEYDAMFSNGGDYLTVPNSMEEANNAFENGLYNNCLQFEVAEDGTDVTIGLVKTQFVSGDWLIWDNWTLEYLGTATPSEDTTTAIDGVEGEGAVVATAIYNVSGTQQSKLTKGINIVKATMADGTVKVTKVLVK